MTKTVREKTRSRPGSLGELYDLLDTAFPTYRTRLGFLNVKSLGEDIEISSQAIYRWFAEDRVPARNVQKLIKLSRGRLNIEMLEPFLG